MSTTDQSIRVIEALHNYRCPVSVFIQYGCVIVAPVSSAVAERQRRWHRETWIGNYGMGVTVEQIRDDIGVEA